MIFEIENYAAMQAAIEKLCSFLENECVSPDGVFNSRLVASELVGNVLRHSNGKATLQGGIRDGFIELVVSSTVEYIPPETTRKADVFAEHGRGLFLVDSVCQQRSLTKEGGIFVKIKIE